MLATGTIGETPPPACIPFILPCFGGRGHPGWRLGGRQLVGGRCHAPRPVVVRCNWRVGGSGTAYRAP